MPPLELAPRKPPDPFRLLAESVRDYAIFMLDPFGNVASWNVGAERIKGYTADEIVGRHFSRFYTEGDLRAGKPGRELEVAAAHGRVEDEGWRVRKDGSRFWANVVITVLRDRTGLLVGFAKMTRDLTRWKRAEDELRASHLLVETVRDYAIFMLDPSGNVASWNAGAERIKGYTADEIVGRHFSRFYTEGDLRAGKPGRELEVAAAHGRVEDEGWRVRKDGSRFWANVVITALRDPTGELVGFAKVTRDLTERKRAEDELRASHDDLERRVRERTADLDRVNAQLRLTEERYRAIVHAQSVIVWTTTPDGGRVESTPAWHEYTGLPEEEVRGENWVRGLDPGDREATAAHFREAFATHKPLRAEYRVRRADGQTRTLSTQAVPLFAGDGAVKEWTGICIDITDQKRMESALRLSEFSVQNTSLATLWITPDARIVRANRAASELLGYAEDELRALAVTGLDPDFTAERWPAHWRELRARKRLTFQTRHRHKTGRLIPVEVDLNWFEFQGQEYNFAYVRDLTERVHLEEQVRQSQKMEAVGQLAGGVAHDFNNLLTVISGYSEILLMALPPDDPRRASVTAICAAGERAAGLTRQLLAFSRKSVLRPQVVDLNAQVSEAEKLLRRLIGEDVLLTTVLDPRCRRVQIDPDQLGQVLMNLAVNARDAMPRGGRLTIETKNVELDEAYVNTHIEVRAGRYALLTVSDTGTGMAPEVRARIFEPFFTTKGVGKGTGLGLSVVHGIVKQSGGNIGAYSEPGIGTTFKVYLPTVDAGAPAGAGARDPMTAGRGTETVLLVEDEDSVRELALLALRTQGYTVLVGADGRHALRVVDAHTGAIDILVTDVVMPEISGSQLAATLQPRFPQMKVLYLSGYTDDAVVRHGILHAEVAFLQKPYTPMVLLRKVRQVLDAGHAPDGAGGPPP